jgi:hypothetical protein
MHGLAKKKIDKLCLITLITVIKPVCKAIYLKDN